MTTRVTRQSLATALSTEPVADWLRLVIRSSGGKIGDREHLNPKLADDIAFDLLRVAALPSDEGRTLAQDVPEVHDDERMHVLDETCWCEPQLLHRRPRFHSGRLLGGTDRRPSKEGSDDE